MKNEVKCAAMSFVVIFVLIVIGLTISEFWKKDLYVHTQEGATTDIFYVCSTETSDWINEQGGTVHFADMNKPEHRAALLNIRAATSATDTGVTICYNSVASPDAEVSVLSGKTVIGINPVNWCTDATPATYVFDYDDANDTLTATLDTVSHLTVIEGYDGTCPMLPFVGKEGNYHCLEIPLYYRSLKHNIALRCEAKHGILKEDDASLPESF